MFDVARAVFLIWIFGFALHAVFFAAIREDLIEDGFFRARPVFACLMIVAACAIWPLIWHDLLSEDVVK